MSAIFQNADHPDIAQVVNEVADTDAVYMLCRDGKAVAVVVGFDRYEALRRAARRDGYVTEAER